MDDFDIYSDLPDFKWLKETYEEHVDIKKEELPISEEDVKKLQEKFLKLEKVHKLVLSHYSSLWKTCKQERKRMDRQIADLRRQLDNLAFKRNHQRRNVVPLPVPIQSLVACPPPLLSINPFSNANQGTLYSYPPLSTNPTLDTNNQEWNQQEQQFDENFVDNLAIPTNVITPENSHSSDESDDDIVKKSHYRSTVYGERLRKKLLEEKRNAVQQKQESLLNEQKVNQENEIASINREIDTKTIKEGNSNGGGGGYIDVKVKNSFQPEQLNHQKQIELQSVVKVISLSAMKEAEVTGTKKEINVRTLKEENNDSRQSKIETQFVKEPSKQEQKKRNQKENNKEDLLRFKRESDIGRQNRKGDLRTSKDNDTDKKRKNDDSNFRRERDLSKKIEDDEVEMRREKNWERRKRNDEPAIRRERDLDRRRKEQEIEKLERRRRQDDAEKRRKDQETERRKKEENDKRRREEIDRKRRDEDIERRKRDEEIERRKRDEFDRRRKEEEERKRKERELEIFKQKEIDRKRKEEEQHVIRLKEIEKKRNEKQLEDLIKERKRIENEMKTLTDDESEKEEKPVSTKDAPCREYCSVEKSQVNKENTKDNSIQVHKKQSDNKKNDEWKADQRSCEIGHSSSANANSQTISSNHRKECQEYASSKFHRQQDNCTTHDKHRHNDRRSRRNQLDRELERRNSSQRNKSRHRDKSNSGGDNHSPKRIKLQEKNKDYRDRSENLGVDKQSFRKTTSPKRKRQSKSKEKSPRKCKKRKISSGRDSDRNIKLDENTISKKNVSANEEIVKIHKENNENISSNCSQNILTKSSLIENVENVGLKKEKEPFAAPLGKNQDRISTQLANLESATKVASKTQDQDPNKNNSKMTNCMADKSSINHANKKKTLMNELFEAQEGPVNISANSKNVKRIEESLNETILSELEDGEITDSDESIDSKGLQKSTLQATQPTEQPVKTIEFSEKNNNKDKFSASLQEINKLTALKSTSEKKDSILYNVLVQSKKDDCQEKTKIESHENVSKKTEPLTLKDNTKNEACKNKIANKAVDKSSFVSKTNNITDVCMKENVDVNNDLTKKSIGSSTIAVNMNKEVLKLALKIETASKDNAAGNFADTSQIKVPIRNVIVIKRRRRPVKLADSPPVVVINNINVKT